MSSWGCPNDIDGTCARVNGRPCDPGMKGCVLFGRFVWADDSKNRPGKQADGNEAKSPQSVNKTKS